MPSTANISEAAKKMRELDVGFLPIGDETTDKIIGTLTDRDIVISGIANKKELNIQVKGVMHKGVCYCYETNVLQEASKSMKDKQISRLIVLNKDKKLTGDTLEQISKH